MLLNRVINYAVHFTRQYLCVLNKLLNQYIFDMGILRIQDTLNQSKRKQIYSKTIRICYPLLMSNTMVQQKDFSILQTFCHVTHDLVILKKTLKILKHTLFSGNLILTFCYRIFRKSGRNLNHTRLCHLHLHLSKTHQRTT